jgi:transposase
MPFKSKRPKLTITTNDKEELIRISKSRTEQKVHVDRSKMLLLYSEGRSINSIAKEMKTNRPKVERTIDRALSFGVLTALNDLPRKGAKPKITKEAKAWLISVACRKPKEFGLSSELWTYAQLVKYIRKNCEKEDHPSLGIISKGTISKILAKSDVKPHKMTYYLEKKDSEFDIKMAQVLCVYKEVEMFKNTKDDKSKIKTAILSYDEKPGIQAIGNIAADLRPVPQLYSKWARDYEYRRYGTLSLLASIDLLTGDVYAEVHEKHRSKEFVGFLKNLDLRYPKDLKIKIILDNHSSHVSKETKGYLKTVPGRFEFVFTPVHASWLNLIEVFFSKMTRSFLRGIRVKSKKELKERILNYIKEVNQMPTVFSWKWKMDQIII